MKKQLAILTLAVGALSLALVLHRRNDRDKRLTIRWPVMGTVAQMTVRGEVSEADRTAFASTVRATYARLNGLVSAWDPDSELSRLAAAGCTNWVDAVSDEVKPCYAAALKLAEESGHAFNPAMGRTLRALGVGNGKYSDFDLGAIAKGFAVDRAAAEILTGTGPAPSLLLDLGGNLRVVGDAVWRTGIRNPFAARHANQPPYVALIALTNGESVATSGNYERFIDQNGLRLSHILDGRTGQPTHGIAGVTVVTPASYGALLADGLSTTLFVLGPDAGAKFLASRYPEALALWIPDTPEDPQMEATPQMAARLENLTVPLRTSPQRSDP